MMSKLIVIGIDSLDPNILIRHKEMLPNFNIILKESQTLKAKSVFPVDTVPAWASIYTGMHPMNHGILYVYDVFDQKLSDLKRLKIDFIRGKTFWDYASDNGCKVAVVYPMLIYPPWSVNGVVISKSPYDRRIDKTRTEVDIAVLPETLYITYNIPKRLESLWGGFPGYKNIEAWVSNGKNIIQKEKDLGLKVLAKEDWNLFFIYFSLLDIIQHRLWRYFDINDPLYPGKNKYENIILDYYKMFDQIIGEIIKMCPDEALMIISDHGHKSRPIATININEYLRFKGYYISQNDSKTKLHMKLKRAVVSVISKLNIEHLAIKLISMSNTATKMGKALYASENICDNSRSLAKLSTFAGIKSYPHGGIKLSYKIKGAKYELLREEIIKLLYELRDINENTIFKWVKKREELYDGKFYNLYPDIVFRLRDDYGVGWDISSGLFGKAYDHKVASGGHSEDSVILIRNVKKRVKKQNISLVDIAPSVLDLLGINIGGYNFDGTSIFKA